MSTLIENPEDFPATEAAFKNLMRKLVKIWLGCGVVSAMVVGVYVLSGEDSAMDLLQWAFWAVVGFVTGPVWLGAFYFFERMAWKQRAAKLAREKDGRA